MLASDDFRGASRAPRARRRRCAISASSGSISGWFRAPTIRATNGSRRSTLVEREPACPRRAFTRARAAAIYARRCRAGADFGQPQPGPRCAAAVCRQGAGPLPPRNELAGRVALLLDGGIDNSERQNALLEAGASAVLTVLDGERTLDNVAARRKRSGYALASDTLGGDLEALHHRARHANAAAGQRQHAGRAGSGGGAGPISRRAARSCRLAGGDHARNHDQHAQPDRQVAGPQARKRRGAVPRALGSFRRSAPSRRPKTSICNGAVDNASGVAALTEIARRLAKGAPAGPRRLFPRHHGRRARPAGRACLCRKPAAAAEADRRRLQHRYHRARPGGHAAGHRRARHDPARSADRGGRAAREAQDRRRAMPPMPMSGGRMAGRCMQHDIPAVMVSSAYGDIARIEAFFEGALPPPGRQPEARDRAGRRGGGRGLPCRAGPLVWRCTARADARALSSRTPHKPRLVPSDRLRLHGPPRISRGAPGNSGTVAHMDIPLGLTFDDVLLRPAESRHPALAWPTRAPA